MGELGRMGTTDSDPGQALAEPSDQGVHPGGRGLWFAVLIPALAGVVFTSIQIVEKIQIVERPETVLSCDINATISCSGVLTAWQSSVLGPPNALIGLIMFAFLASAGLAGVLGTRPSRAYLAVTWGLAVFFLCFASWFMYQTAFNIGLLCIWCTGIVTSVVIICAGLTRLAHHARVLGDGSFGRALDTGVRYRLDLVLWVGWWIVIAELLWLGLNP